MSVEKIKKNAKPTAAGTDRAKPANSMYFEMADRLLATNLIRLNYVKRVCNGMHEFRNYF